MDSESESSETESSSSTSSSSSGSGDGDGDGDEHKPTDSDGTTASYSSLEEDEADQENNGWLRYFDLRRDERGAAKRKMQKQK